MRRSIPASQWVTLTYLHGHTCGKVGRDINGNAARALARRGLAVRKPSVGPHGGKGVWYDITMAGIEAYNKTTRRPHLRTEEEDLQGALEEDRQSRKVYAKIHERDIMPEPRRHQQLHEFLKRKRPPWDLCQRCGQTREDGAHPQPTKREIAQKMREEMDQLLANADQDFSSLESNVQDIEVTDIRLTKSQKQRLESLKEDIENLLEQWP